MWNLYKIEKFTKKIPVQFPETGSSLIDFQHPESNPQVWFCFSRDNLAVSGIISHIPSPKTLDPLRSQGDNSQFSRLNLTKLSFLIKAPPKKIYLFFHFQTKNCHFATTLRFHLDSWSHIRNYWLFVRLFSDFLHFLCNFYIY